MHGKRRQAGAQHQTAERGQQQPNRRCRALAIGRCHLEVPFGNGVEGTGLHHMTAATMPWNVRGACGHRWTCIRPTTKRLCCDPHSGFCNRDAAAEPLPWSQKTGRPQSTGAGLAHDPAAAEESAEPARVEPQGATISGCRGYHGAFQAADVQPSIWREHQLRRKAAVRSRKPEACCGSIGDRPALAVTARHRTPGFMRIQAVAPILRWQFPAIGRWLRSAPDSR